MVDVGSSLVLLAAIILPSAAVGGVAVKRYIEAHKKLMHWQRGKDAPRQRSV